MKERVNDLDRNITKEIQMADKYLFLIEKVLNSLIIRRGQIKTIVDICDSVLTRWA